MSKTHQYVLALKKQWEQVEFKMAIKIALTAIFSLLLSFQLDKIIPHPDPVLGGLWCVISSIIVLQENLGGTYKAIWNRLLGVIIGSLCGAFFAAHIGSSVEMLGLAILTTVVLCSLLGLQDSYRIASLSVAVVIIPWEFHPVVGPWTSAFFRFLDTCLGFVVAIVMTHLLWPSQALTKMRLNMAYTFSLLRQFYEHLLIPLNSPHKSQKISQSLVDEVQDSLVQSRLILGESKVELFLRFTPIGIWVDLINYQVRLWDSLLALQNVFNLSLEEVFDEELKQQVKQIVETIDLAFNETALELRTGKANFNFGELTHLQKKLNEELMRFRTTKATKKYNLDVVEQYFVFFYQLKQVAIILQEFNSLFIHLKIEAKPSALDM